MLQRLDYSAKLHLLKKKPHQHTVLHFSLASHSFSSITQMHKGKRQQTENDAQEVPPDHQEEFLYCVSDCALEEIAQRGCGDFLTGDGQQPPGQNPVPCALG